jgi:hypothetical protein
VNLPELVRYAVGHGDDVALGQLPGIAVTDCRAADLVRLGRLPVHDHTPGHKRRPTALHVDDVGVERVHFGHPRLVAAAGVNHVVSPTMAVEQDGSLRE